MRAVSPAPVTHNIDRELLDEYELDGHPITHGTTVKVLTASGTKHDFTATIMAIHRYPDGRIELDVFGGAKDHKSTRTFGLERLEWTKQPKAKPAEE